MMSNRAKIATPLVVLGLVAVIGLGIGFGITSGSSAENSLEPVPNSSGLSATDSESQTTTGTPDRSAVRH